MEYEQILIRYGEIALKGKNRRKFEEQLRRNVKESLAGFPNITLKRTFDRLHVQLNGEDYQPVVERLQKVFGIQSLSLSMKVKNDLEEIQKGALAALRETNNEAKTFKITGKRPNKDFPINSQELNHLVGGYVLKHTENLKVDVHNPDVNIRIEVKSEATYISCTHFRGAGGLPVGSSGKVMLMLSGGIDSPVAGYLTMKRGIKIEAVHFHSPPFTSERAKQKVEDLAKVLTAFGGEVRLHVVPFTAVQKAIKDKIPDSYSMTIMRRMMLRITEKLAVKHNALGIVTGESLGQVASQTLESMHTINEVTNYPVIRPLAGMDKVEIMEISHHIGTYDISIRPYEDCCTIFLPSAPKTKPNRLKANKFEQYLEVEALASEAVDGTEMIMLKPNQLVEEQFEELF
ncbi:tRNA uracil 4-sulfurtransferase ThiI [Bacillus taeanensis]|uniref:Probable tRNA sulfurtransferase n=1 Tax=Bacillus taeanensis TaxID=273032 RepID=A0A366Y0T9_9BACI|nr:tRNA uracil 4-sulfurtransferase ThiI [Bacillus taeanensis]RBW71458.1 tRNA 4-thiouridine(8) synthase ThiI [Bacillus taeanensis]